VMLLKINDDDDDDIPLHVENDQTVSQIHTVF